MHLLTAKTLAACAHVHKPGACVGLRCVRPEQRKNVLAAKRAEFASLCQVQIKLTHCGENRQLTVKKKAGCEIETN